ncbi:MAG: hypothetical protein PHY72_02005 [Candidatus Pacebacteria bacterium]|nr:hypothetical protein [Candidatus Paceibacterota bacterium]
MANMSNNDKTKLEALFGMRSGYVLDFSGNTFQDFIHDSTGLDIFDSKYNHFSGSKANRLRAFWQKESDNIVGKLIADLLEYWKTQKEVKGNEIEEIEQKLYGDCINISKRLLGERQEYIDQQNVTEDDFLNKEFQEISLEKLGLESVFTNVLNQRMDEIKRCLGAKASLAAIFLCGSILEGILLGFVIKKPEEFNRAILSPKDKNGKVLQFHEWKLSSLIDVSHEVGLLGDDVKKFSHALREFRNYIHPYQQASSGFNPDGHTAKICWQVLKAAISDLSKV